ncbi:MAG: FdrA family protein [Actinomycetia bacterium]|nr:FdrA family protein [Actinomycetes bacterium]
MTDHVEVRPGLYHDSVTLMLLSQSLGEGSTVEHAMVAMGTALNVELLVDAGYELGPVTPGDLIVAFRADSASVEQIRGQVDHLLSQSTGRGGAGERTGGGEAEPAHSLGHAISQVGATVALISVPGEHAFREAIDAIEAGAHPIIFSDNVSVEHEVLLKKAAASVGLLAMGPDCGTVILSGTGLGFANVVTPGPIGLVSASGTGAQQVCALCDQAGVGVRHVLGLGGRDLSDEVGGLSALAAIDILDADPTVEVIGIIAKEIGLATRSRLDRLLAEITTPSVVVATDDLTAGAAALTEAAGVQFPEPRTWSPAHRPSVAPSTTTTSRILGLYSGGTLALEADRILTGAGIEAEIIDLGADEYTRGRPHPMIDYRLRLDRLGAAAGDPDIRAVLLDVVLGHGAAPDPAAELGPAITGLEVPVLVALIGTSGDPQNLESQAERLTAAGATVFASNAETARAAAAIVKTNGDPS